jgi:phage terminase large subunit GpA-like protein
MEKKKKRERSAIEGFLRGLMPVKRMTVSEWADQYRFLSELASAEPGRWRTSRAPYLRDIQDALSSAASYQRIIVMKGAQLGLTEAGLNWLGYLMDNDPCPILAVMPTDSTMRRNSKTRIEPMIEATPRLRDKILVGAKRDSQTMFEKSFEGGILLMCGANSPSNLASQPVRALFLDEVDRYPADAGGEGSPEQLAEARTRTFARRKIFKISTPVTKGESAIEREYELTDQREYHVPCPECGTMQTLVFEQLRYTYDAKQKAARDAHYECAHCGHHIPEHKKPEMLSAGEWIASAPEKSSPVMIGFYINSLYSPYGWFSWDEIATQYERAIGDNLKMKVFTNTTLGLPFAESGEVPSWEALYNRRETYAKGKPPKGVVMLTCGVDVQKNRLEYQVVGWGRNDESWVVDWDRIPGDPAEAATWEKLAAVVNTIYTREDGVQLPLSMMAVDTGYLASHVYDFCRRFDISRVVAIKGSDNPHILVSPPRTIDYKPDGSKLDKLTIALWQVGVSVIKSDLYARLKLARDGEGNAPRGFVHFGEFNEPEYFKQLTAEQLTFSVKKGRTKYEWTLNYHRNEALDMWIYARAAAIIRGIDRWTDDTFRAFEDQAALQIAKNSGQNAPAKRKPASDFW